MIILGAQDKQKPVGSGEFYCPQCEVRRQYVRKRVKRYFTLYFIPILPLDDLGEYIECETCHLTFNLDVLDLKPKRRKLTLVEMLNSIGDLLNGGMPIEYLIRDLTAAGLEREAALKTISAYLSDARKQCPNCGLTYADPVDICTECHQSLETYAP